MSRESLADRLINYSDGIVAATFVFMTGLGAAVGDEDTRCAIAEVHRAMLVFVLLAGIGAQFSLWWLRKWSYRLREEIEQSSEESLIRKRLDTIRMTLVLAFILGACTFLYSLHDVSCTVP